SREGELRSQGRSYLGRYLQSELERPVIDVHQRAEPVDNAREWVRNRPIIGKLIESAQQPGRKRVFTVGRISPSVHLALMVDSKPLHDVFPAEQVSKVKP